MTIIDAHQHIMTQFDPSGEKLVRYMDGNGIEKALVIGCEDRMSGHVGNNETVAEAVKRFPDRLAAACYVDPRAVEEAQDAIIKYHDRGFKCVKMFPFHGFYPDDPAFCPLYELIEELKMALMFHCGGSTRSSAETERIAGRKRVSKPVSYKYSLPCYYDGLGHGFPEMKIILAHMGGCLHLEEIFYLVWNHKNMYLDTSCSLATAALREVLRRDNRYVKPLDFNKLLWGQDGLVKADTEGPSARLVEQQELLVKLVGDDREKLENIFYNNARRVLEM